MPICCSDFEKLVKFTRTEFFVLDLKYQFHSFQLNWFYYFLLNSKSERLKLHTNSFNFFRALSRSKLNSSSNGVRFIFGIFFIESIFLIK
ncbi:unnamed protein product [Blepharisma stoltei]|uniref:Uncharacterized protein n=1 Tax=Blepharisma stoltei TaxID=1481888 RepID=A0AAU9JTS5_9CILI|nr:unnamed protein product [Blepharisma stoltei]